MWNRKHQPKVTLAETENENDTPPAEASTAQAPQPDAVETRTFTGSGDLLELAKFNGAVVTIATDPSATVLTAAVTGYGSRLDKLKVDAGDGLSITSNGINVDIADVRLVPKVVGTFDRLFGTKSGYDVDTKLITDPKKDQLSLTIVVPEGTNIRLRGMISSVAANGTYGQVDAHVPYNATLLLGTISGLVLQASARSTITIKQLDGNCEASLRLDSTLVVAAGTIEVANINAEWGCAVELPACNSVAYEANYESKLQIKELTGALEGTIKPESTVKVLSGTADALHLRASYNCTILAHCSLRRAEVIGQHDNKVTLHAVTDYLSVTAGDGSRLGVNTGDGTREVQVVMGRQSVVDLAGTIETGSIKLSGDTRCTYGALGAYVWLDINGTTLRGGRFDGWM